MLRTKNKLQQGHIKIHDRDLRGKTNMGWLDSKHTFSFGHFMDPTRLGFHALRVFNDDIVAPGAGFGEHPHDNMEIISYVLEGALEHKDSMGTGSVIRPGELQKMSAGKGVTHSEYNHSSDEPVHFYQIWIVPDRLNIEPSYEQKTLDPDALIGGFSLVGDREGTNGGITIQQNAKMFMARLNEGQETSYDFAPNRAGFLQVVRGHVALNGETLKEGDGAEISGIATIKLIAETDCELMLFDLG